MPSSSIDSLPGVRRIENCSKEELTSLVMEMTHAVYPHDQVYGDYCTVQTHVDCPADRAYAYLADVRNLAEWTFSMRDFGETTEGGAVVATDWIGGKTKIFTRVRANSDAMTVDYHCAWDQPDKLWMIYLMRVVPAPLVLGKDGCVILWTNCRHAYYDENPFPAAGPSDRKVWVGDMWPFFYAGHSVELENLRLILEHRHQNADFGSTSQSAVVRSANQNIDRGAIGDTPVDRGAIADSREVA